MATILIVDDNEEDVRKPLKRMLGRLYSPDNILEAENGRAAVDLVGKQRPDVIVLDIMMPVMDGISACQAIRDDPDNTGIYIIMLTGRDGGLPEGLDVGADAYLRKPCDFEELAAVVRKGVEQVEQYNSAMERQRALESKVGGLSEIRWALQDIITSMDTALILCAPNVTGRIRYMNPSAMNLVDRLPRELREVPIGELFFEADMDRLLDGVLGNAKPNNIHKTLMSGKGAPVPVSLAGRVISDTGGREKWILLELRPR